MSYYANAMKLKTEIDRNRESAEMVERAGGIRTETEQSDKLGFDFLRYYVNNILVRSDYVEQEIPMGTAEHPIKWKPNMKLIPNAYYTHEGVRKVWMGQAGVVADWEDPYFTEW